MLSHYYCTVSIQFLPIIVYIAEVPWFVKMLKDIPVIIFKFFDLMKKIEHFEKKN